MTRLLVGAYGSGEPGSLGAIHLLEHDAGAGTLTLVGPPLALTAPSYLVPHPALPIVYAVGETTPAGSVAALRVDPAALRPGTPDAGAGWLEVVSARPIAGAEPCHLVVDPAGRFLVSADYGSGSVGVYALDAAGLIGEQVQDVRLTGSGPDPDRQAAAHAHQVSFDPADGALRVVDLGSDQVHRFALDPVTGALSPLEPVRQPAGSGPRHLADHAAGAYVTYELANAVGPLRPAAPVAASHAEPGGVRNYPSGLEFAPDGRFLYVANRGSNTLAIFGLNGAGRPEFVAEAPTLGDWPRQFVLHGDSVYIANQYSGTVTVLDRDGDSGELRPTPALAPAPGASCVLPADLIG